MIQDINKIESFRLLEQTIGVMSIKIMSNEFQAMPGYDGESCSFQKIVFHIEEEEPDIFAIGILFSLSLMSFTYAAPRGYSENEFIPDEEWNLGYFIQGLEFQRGHLRYYGDYVSGRMMKTDIIYEPGGRITLTATNRGKNADKWMTLLQGKRHIKLVKK